MKVVGLTGGIGSGKSTVANFFLEMGIPVYIADQKAKKIQDNSEETRLEIIALLGEKAYDGTVPNRAFIASKVFYDPILLKKLNEIMHPKVRADFKSWKNLQKGDYCLYEAAILFETKGEQSCDLTILVTAPYELKIKRLMERDRVNREEIEARMAAQWSDSEKAILADFIIENIELTNTQKQVVFLHKKLTAVFNS